MDINIHILPYTSRMEEIHPDLYAHRTLPSEQVTRIWLHTTDVTMHSNLTQINDESQNFIRLL
jgi:hypothetical protein